MINIKKLILLCFSFNLFFFPAYSMDQKVKVFTTMAGYGVVGGALLGTATMAFGSSSRAIAKGASLGLYSGLIFGSYVLISYEVKKRGFYTEPVNENYYPDSKDPYYDDQSSINIQSNFNKIAKSQIKDTLWYLNLFEYKF